MKTLYKLLTLLLFISLSHNIYSQITVEKAVAIDENKNGKYDAVEIKFSVPVDDNEMETSFEVKHDWIFSLDKLFGSFEDRGTFYTDVYYIANAIDANDRYVRLKFSSEFNTSNDTIYFKHELGSLNDSVTAYYGYGYVVPFALKYATDTAAPVIDNITSVKIGSGVGNYLMVKDTIKFTVTPLVSELGITVLPEKYNGQDLNWETVDGSEYVGKYPVVEGDQDQLNPLQLLGVSLTDNNLNKSDTVNTTDITWSIDANTPVIVSNEVTSDANVVGVLKVGDQIIFTVDVETPDGNLSVTSDVYNGKTINWYTSDGGDTYKGIYTVEIGDDQDPAPEITGVILTDPAGNTSAPVGSSDVIKSIDTNIPVINSVEFNPTSGIEGVNGSIDVKITVAGTEENLIADTLIINNTYVLTSELEDSTGGIYGFTYNIDIGDNEVAEYEAIPISFVLRDLAGNLSVPYTNSLAENCPGIDTHTPVLDSVVSNATKIDTLIVGESIIFTAYIKDADPSLTITPGTYNGENLNWSTTDGGATYVGKYVVKEGNNDVFSNPELGIVTVSDPAGNFSTKINDDVVVSVDAHSPTIASVSLLNKPKHIGEVDTLFISVTDGSNLAGYKLLSGQVAGRKIDSIQLIDKDNLYAFFTLQENGVNILKEDSIDITNLQISDFAGNKSDSFGDTIIQNNDALYGRKPEAIISGSYEECHKDSAEIVFSLSGIAPFTVELKETTGAGTIYPIVNTSSNTYNWKVEADTAINNPMNFIIVNVTDSTGNTNTGIGNAQLTVNYLIEEVSIVSPRNSIYNITEPADTLIGNYNNAGVFSGNGVSPMSKKFAPSVAGIDEHKIIYTYSENGCTDSDTTTLTVIETKGNLTFSGADNIYCHYESEFTAYGFNKDNDTLITFRISNNADTALVVNTIDTTATIYPTKLNPGVYELTYVFGYPVRDSVTKSFTIEKAHSSINFTGIVNNQEFCEDYDTIFVNAVNLIPSGGNGEYMFSGLSAAFEYDLVADDKYNIGYLIPDLISPGLDTLKYVYTTPNGCQSDTVHKPFVINSLPTVDLPMDGVYNIRGGKKTITPITAVDGSGTYHPTNYWSNITPTSGDFDPFVADIGIDTTWYIYIDAITGCQNVDSAFIEVKLPAVSFVGLDTLSTGENQYCYFNSVADTIRVDSLNGDWTEKNFFIDDVVRDTLVDGSLLLNPAALYAGDHKIKYSYKDKDDVYYEIEELFNIDSIGDFSFTGLVDNYCEDDNKEYDLIFINPSGDIGTYEYTASGDGINVNTFNPYVAKIGTHTITSTFTREYSGCYKSVNEITNVNKVPEFDFILDKKCVVDNRDSVLFTTDTLSTDNVDEWYWKIINIEGIQESYTDSTKFSLVPQYDNTVQLTLTTNKECSLTKSEPVFIGSEVDIDFSWDKECHGETVTFDVLEFTAPKGIYRNYWEFGGLGDVDTTDVYNPQFKYSAAGGYTVTYFENTIACGLLSVSKEIFIRPSVKINGGDYFEDFEEGSAVTGWAVDILESSSNYSWEWGTPNGTKIKSAASGTGAFVTNLTGDYENGELSYLSSPCFDFSALQKPMIKFDFISALEFERDGVILQYSVIKDEWISVGVYGEGVNWFNSFQLKGNILGQPSGWNLNGLTLNAADTSRWNNAKYWLDDVAGSSGVRFRFALGTDEFGTDEGFGLDNVWIGDRNRLVLLEHFASPFEDDIRINQERINDIVKANPQDVLPIQFFTSFPTPNEISNFYTAGPSARSLFYGISQVPYSVVDGGDRKFNYSSTNTLKGTDINKRMLEESKFEVVVKQGVENNNLNIVATIKAIDSNKKEKISARVVVVERAIISDVENLDHFINVVRTMLPDPAGSLIDKEWAIGDSINIYHSWSIPDGVVSDSLVTIVFLQNEETKEIYQTGYTNNFTTVTGVDEFVNTLAKYDYIVYPNPATDNLTVQLMRDVKSNMQLKLYNNIGVLVKSKEIRSGENGIDFSIAELPVGFYFLHIEGNGEQFEIKKIIKSN